MGSIIGHTIDYNRVGALRVPLLIDNNSSPDIRVKANKNLSAALSVKY